MTGLCVTPPTAGIRVGELIQPGLEYAGSVFAFKITSKVVDLSTFKTERVALDTPLLLRPGVDFEFVGPIAKCVHPVASASAVDVASAQVYAQTSSGPHTLISKSSYDASDVGDSLSPNDLSNYVVVTDAVSPVVGVDGCPNAEMRLAAERQLSSLVIAYQAIAPFVGFRQQVVGPWNVGPWNVDRWNAGQWDYFYKFLGAFGIGELANRATITLNTVTTNPIGQSVGWANIVTLGGHTASSATDDEFKMWGRTPVIKKRIGTGKYFFRLRRSDNSFTTVTRELTLSDDGTNVALLTTVPAHARNRKR